MDTLLFLFLEKHLLNTLPFARGSILINESSGLAKVNVKEETSHEYSDERATESRKAYSSFWRGEGWQNVRKETKKEVRVSRDHAGAESD